MSFRLREQAVKDLQAIMALVEDNRRRLVAEDATLGLDGRTLTRSEAVALALRMCREQLEAAAAQR
jgi:hypothetical protein